MSDVEKTFIITLGYIAFISFFITMGYWCFNPSWKIAGLAFVLAWLSDNLYNIRKENEF